jgi:hypothetical protein
MLIYNRFGDPPLGQRRVAPILLPAYLQKADEPDRLSLKVVRLHAAVGYEMIGQSKKAA